MDKIIVTQKLESLRHCVQRIQEKKPTDISILTSDLDIQDILVLNLTRAIQLCVDIGSHLISKSEASPPNSMGEVFAILEQLNIISKKTGKQLKKAVGFRNIAVHNYENVNWEIVFAICNSFLEDFKNFAREVDVHIKNL